MNPQDNSTELLRQEIRSINARLDDAETMLRLISIAYESAVRNVDKLLQIRADILARANPLP